MASLDFFVREIPVYIDMILSPMDGFSDLPFRQICRGLDSDMSYAEFVNVDELRGKHGGARKARKSSDSPNTQGPSSSKFTATGSTVSWRRMSGCRKAGQSSSTSTWDAM